MNLFKRSFSVALLVATTYISAIAVAASEIIVGEDILPAFEKLEASMTARLEPLEATSQNNVEPQLINGTPVNPALFPAIFRMTTGGTCTATVVGPAAILLAAHCVGHFQRIAFVAGGQEVFGICERAPGYHSVSNRSEDWALCLLERTIAGFAYESVDVENIPSAGARLVLTGYGCTFKGGRSDGLLRIGVSTVVDKPATNWPKETSTIYTKSDPSAGEAILCPGDSGGPLFRVSDDLGAARTVVGVNSRTTFEYGVSFFAATGSEAGSSFVANWIERHQQKICGVNLFVGCK